MKLSIDLIDPNPNQPRKRFADIEELAESIRQHGLLEPVMVRSINGRYQIIHGERRWHACKVAGLTEIEIVIRDVSAEEAYQLALVENLQRQDLNPMEEAEAFCGLQQIGWTQTRIAGLVGKSQQFIASRLTLLNLPESIREQITTRVVTASHGEVLAGIKDPALQTELARRIGEEKLSVKAVREAALSVELLSGGGSLTQLSDEWVLLTRSGVKVRCCISPRPGMIVEGDALPRAEWFALFYAFLLPWAKQYGLLESNTEIAGRLPSAMAWWIGDALNFAEAHYGLVLKRGMNDQAVLATKRKRNRVTGARNKEETTGLPYGLQERPSK